jgi:hypothetical protein
MAQQTAVEWLVSQQKHNKLFDIEIIEQAKQMEKEQIKEEIIGFQIYLNDEGYVENHNWDFEKEAIVYLYKNK